MRFLLFWEVTNRKIVVVTHILVKPVCPIFDGQAWPLKKRLVGFPATSV